MVARTNLQQVNMLYGEARMIDQALQGFANGGRIVEMSVSPGPLLPEGDDPVMRRPMGISVPVSTIDYPPQMVEAIRASLEDRKKQIEAQLTELGLTDQ